MQDEAIPLLKEQSIRAKRRKARDARIVKRNWFYKHVATGGRWEVQRSWDVRYMPKFIPDQL